MTARCGAQRGSSLCAQWCCHAAPCQCCCCTGAAATPAAQVPAIHSHLCLVFLSPPLMQLRRLRLTGLGCDEGLAALIQLTSLSITPGSDTYVAVERLPHLQVRVGGRGLGRGALAGRQALGGGGAEVQKVARLWCAVGAVQLRSRHVARLRGVGGGSQRKHRLAPRNACSLPCPAVPVC